MSSDRPAPAKPGSRSFRWAGPGDSVGRPRAAAQASRLLAPPLLSPSPSDSGNSGAPRARLSAAPLFVEPFWGWPPPPPDRRFTRRHFVAGATKGKHHTARAPLLPFRPVGRPKSGVTDASRASGDGQSAACQRASPATGQRPGARPVDGNGGFAGSYGFKSQQGSCGFFCRSARRTITHGGGRQLVRHCATFRDVARYAARYFGRPLAQVNGGITRPGERQAQPHTVHSSHDGHNCAVHFLNKELESGKRLISGKGSRPNADTRS
eukprot:gene8647-biopygen19656